MNPATDGMDATEYVWFLYQILVLYRCDQQQDIHIQYCMHLIHAVTGSDFSAKIQTSFGTVNTA